MTWTAETTGFEATTTQPFLIVSDEVLSVAVLGNMVADPALTTSSVIASTDGGITWAAGSSVLDPAAASGTFSSNASLGVPQFGNGIFACVASLSPDSFLNVGDSYAIQASPATPGIWTSVLIPGMSTVTGGGKLFYGFGFGEGIFMASSYNQANLPFPISTWTSSDGITYTETNFPHVGNWVYDFANDGAGKWVAVGDFGGTGVSSYTSVDSGATWTPHTTAGVDLMYRVFYHSGLYIGLKFFGSAQPMLFASTDGETWIPVAVDALNTGGFVQAVDVSWAAGYWWACATDFITGNELLAKSLDGDTWVLDPNPWDSLTGTRVAVGVRETTVRLLGAGFKFPAT